MNHIIGNQEKRTSKVDTEKWKEHREYYNNQGNIRDGGLEKKDKKKDEETSVKEETMQKGPTGLEGKITLRKQEHTLIRVPTQEKYDTLMQILDAAGWKWYNGESPISIKINRWLKYEKFTCITAENSFSLRVYPEEISELESVYTLKSFCKYNNITRRTIKELNEWYNTNYPDRKCKGK